MNRQEIENKLENLRDLELSNRGNLHGKIIFWVNEYKSIYGETEFINEFVTDYVMQKYGSPYQYRKV
ncbi:MAG: hypothetical protein AABY22_04465 [Nanoarchaeota archaeon]